MNDDEGGRGLGQLDRVLHVPQLAHVEVPPPARAREAEQQVAGRLHDALSDDDAFALQYRLAFVGGLASWEVAGER